MDWEKSTILPGVRIGYGSIIAANSIVTKEVPPYAIVGGIPAKVKGYRFSKKDIKLLLKFKWLEKDLKWIKSQVGLFQDFSKFSRCL